MAKSQQIAQLQNLAKNVGLESMSVLYPNDFEWYMIALELADSNDNTIDYLTFPIMPNAITKTEPKRTNIKKTLGGITVYSDPTFTPQEINLSGSFGRNFKIMLNNKVSAQGLAYSIFNGKYSAYSVTERKGFGNFSMAGKLLYSMNIKTGYGVVKILQAMLDKSTAYDSAGRPFRLYFYNLAFGESYLVAVPPSGSQFLQDLGNNMIWNYNVTLMTLAPMEAIRNSGNVIKNRLLPSAIQQAVRIGAGELSRMTQQIREKAFEKYW